MTIRTIWVKGEVPYTKNFGTLAELLALVPSTEFAEGFASDHGRIDWVKGSGWMSGGKLLSADGSTSLAGLLRVEDGLVASTTGYIDLMAYSPILDGVTPDDAAMALAVADCISRGSTLLLPPRDIVLAQRHSVNRIHGTPGKTRIIVPADHHLADGTPYPRPYLLRSENYRIVFDANPEVIDYRGFEIVPPSTGGVGFSAIVLASVGRGVLEDIKVIATDTTATYDPLIDIFACCKHVDLIRVQAENRTDALIGAALAVRNVCSTVTAPYPTTEFITARNCKFVTTSHDEAVAVYPMGERITQHCHFYDCEIVGEIGVSVRQQRVATCAILGIDNWLHDCVVKDYSIQNHVMRLGHDGEDVGTEHHDCGTERCIFELSRDTWAHDQWVAGGSIGQDPDLAIYIYRMIEQQSGTITTTYRGNRSINDRIISTGASSAYYAVYGGEFQDTKVSGCQRGSYYSRVVGAESAWEVSGVAHYMPSILEGRTKTGATGSAAILLVSSTQAHVIRNAEIETGGARLLESSGATATTLTIRGIKGTIAASGVLNALSIANPVAGVRLYEIDCTGPAGAALIATPTNYTFRANNVYNNTAVA